MREHQEINYVKVCAASSWERELIYSERLAWIKKLMSIDIDIQKKRRACVQGSLLSTRTQTEIII